MGRKRNVSEKPKRGLGKKARKQPPPQIPAYLKEVKGIIPVLWLFCLRFA
jgi:hypothetical protein